ncbi:MAG TPA: secondary thiamine-phosphate synthase enzyme YjbQ [Desulfurivibrionaceae bacterium]|nr:secondary thiamine-phosphate synthase enzyme YjbQ [Desulfurivibrionaceae bacterium]
MAGGTITVPTSRQMELIDITAEVAKALRASGINDGLCLVYNPHTTAGLTINEGADPDVQRDLIAAFREMVPLDFPYRHAEGNSPAHVMTTLTGSSVSVFVEGGSLKLGTWQKIFFCEYDGPRTRKIHWRILAG